MMAPATKTRPDMWICGFLVAITWIVFGQTIRHDFVNFDDKVYVYGNPILTSGLTLRGIGLAFTRVHALNWHPLTTMSHMLDCTLFRLNAGGHHFTNVLLHTIAVLLLFLVLWDMTGSHHPVAGSETDPEQTDRVWRSAFVAALFAIHPLRVESVAWIAERKDVLSAVFFMLTLGAYVRYARRRTLGRYVTLSIMFACGVMSKPMLVTVPFVLLLLDYWPLDRARTQKPEVSGQWSVVRGFVVEKLPLFAMSAASCVATMIAQRRWAGEMEQFPFTWRIENAGVSCVIYLLQMFWPANLAVFYPANPIPIWQAILAFAFLIAVSALAIALRKNRPYIFVGWFWYLGMLVPVIGILQIGLQGHADRYTYLSQIGLYLLVTWILADILKTSRMEHRTPNIEFSAGHSALGVRRWTFAVCLMLIAALAGCAWAQTKFWKNSGTLWTHTLAVTSNNYAAHHGLGLYLAERGQIDEAISHYEAALKILSSAEEARYNVSRAMVHNDLGKALLPKGQLDEAVAHYEKAITLRPDYAEAHFNLGRALLQQGRTDEAIAEWTTRLSIDPNDVDGRTALGDALARKHRIGEALTRYQEVLKIAPHYVVALNNLAWIRSTCPDASMRDGARALELASKANNYSGGNNPVMLRTLAAALAETGRFDDAIQTAEHALQFAHLTGLMAHEEELRLDIDLYRQRIPLRDFNLSIK